MVPSSPAGNAVAHINCINLASISELYICFFSSKNFSHRSLSLSFCRSKITPKTNFSQSSYNSIFMTDIRWWAPADIYWHSWPLNSQLFPSRDSRGGHALYEPGQILFNAEGGSFTKPIKISKTFWQIRRKHWKTVHLTTVQDTSWWQSVHAFSFLTTGGTFLTQATWEWL